MHRYTLQHPPHFARRDPLSAAHRLWRIPELVDEIFSYLPKSDLAVLLRTTRPFFDPAARHLWKEVDIYALQCLLYAARDWNLYRYDIDSMLRRYLVYEKYFRSVEFTATQATPPTVSNWSSFSSNGWSSHSWSSNAYTNGTSVTSNNSAKKTSVPDFRHQSVYSIPLLLTKRVEPANRMLTPVLPQLQSLSLELKETPCLETLLDMARLCIVPTIKSFSLTMEPGIEDGDRSILGAGSLCDYLDATCRGLTHLDLKLRLLTKHKDKPEILKSCATHFAQRLRYFLPGRTELKNYTSNAWSYDPRIIHALSQLHRLKTLTITHNQTTIAQLAPWDLESGIVAKVDPSRLAQRLAYIETSKWFSALQTLTLDEPPYAVHRVIPNDVFIPSSRGFMESLTDLTLTLRVGPAADMCSPVPALLRMLSQSLSMKRLVLQSHHPSSLSDSDLRPCAQAWSKLELLEIWLYGHGARVDGLTSRTLLNLASSCTYLTELTLPLQHIEPLDLPQDFVPSHQPMTLAFPCLVSSPGARGIELVRSLWQRADPAWTRSFSGDEEVLTTNVVE